MKRTRLGLATAVVVSFTFVALGAPRPGESAHPGRNGRIAFVWRGTLQSINVDGTGRRTIVRGIAGDPRAPVATPEWSPDGKRIAFSCRGRICVVNANGTGLKALTRRVRCREGGGKAVDASPTWSPDGRTLAFDRTCPESQGAFFGKRARPRHDGPCLASSACVIRMRADGSNLRQIVQAADAPRWSPTGREIAYMRGGGVCYSGPHGGSQKVVSPGYDYVGTLDWSPDGRRLAFREPDLGGAVVVAAKNRSTKVSLGRGGTPAFSPDGKQIAYGFYGEHAQRFRGRIFVMNADGQGKRVLVAGADPAWQPLRR